MIGQKDNENCVRLMHFDDERYIGILEFQEIQMAILPPYRKNCLKHLDKNFEFERPMATLDNFDLAFNEVREEARIATLNRLMNLWIKMSHGSAAALNPEKTRSKLLRTVEREFSQGRFNQSDIKDIHTIHLVFGFTDKQKANILRLSSIADDKTKKNVDYLMSHVSGEWKKNLPGFIQHVKFRLIPNQRFEEAHNALKAMKLYNDEIPDDTEQAIDKMIDVTKANLIALARERGDRLAKPWQKWLYS